MAFNKHQRLISSSATPLVWGPMMPIIAMPTIMAMNIATASVPPAWNR